MDHGELLSAAQEAIWAYETLDVDRGAFNIPLVVDLQGELDTSALLEAVSGASQRHESLRTAFLTDRFGGCRRVVAPAAKIHARLVDLPPDRFNEADVDLAVRAFVERPFIPERAPLARATLFRSTGSRHTLVFSAHHLVADGWSMGLLCSDFARAYNALRVGDTLPPADDSASYSDYVSWQREWLATDACARQIAHWGSRLAGVQRMGLSGQSTEPLAPSARVGVVDFALGAEHLELLRGVARVHRTTLFVCLLAAYQLTLSALTESDSVTVGVLSAGRSHPMFAGVVGCFVNTLVVHCDGVRSRSLTEHVPHVHTTVVEAYANEAVPVHILRSRLVGAGADWPRLETCFSLGGPVPLRVPFGRTSAHLPYLGTATALYDIDVDAWDASHGLRVRLSYRDDVVARRRVLELADRFRRTIESETASLRSLGTI
jgi:Condensation domain